MWLGHDENLDRQVAIKVLHAHLLADDAARQRLEREARTAARLNHPNVIAVYDVLVTDDLAAAVLEYVPGEGLDDRIRRTGRLPADEAARIGAELAAGLAAAHAEGILHRDVKPANVLLGEDGRARLADFGIAQALDGSGATLTEAGNVVGTLRYMAPERLEGKDPTPASDVWGLGALMLEATTGRPPYDVRTPVELLEMARRAAPDVGDVPAALAPTVAAMLATDPTSRPTASDLVPVLQGEAVASPMPVEATGAQDAPTELLSLPAAAVAAEVAPGAEVSQSPETPTAAPPPKTWQPMPWNAPPKVRVSRRAATALAAIAGVIFVLAVIWAGSPPATGSGDAGGLAPPSESAKPPSAPTLEPTPKPGKHHGKHGGEGD